MAFFGQALIVALAVALVALGASRRWLARRLALRRPGAAPARLGRPVAVRPLAGGADRRRAGGARVRANSARRMSPSALAVAAKLYPVVLVPLARRVRLATRGQPRGARLCRTLPRSSPSSSRPFLVLAPGGVWDSVWSQARAAAPDREPRRRRCCSSPTTSSGPGHDGVEPRLAEPRRDGAGRARGPPDARAGCGARLRPGSGSRAGRRPGSGSSWRAPPPSSRSSRSGRCSRRSS